MKLVFGTDSIEKNISNMGVSTVGEIKDRLADAMGFDPDTTETRINGVLVDESHTVNDTDTLSVSNKANGKG